MDIEVFIVAHFDSMKLCLTNGNPQKRTVGGNEYLFTNQIVSMTLPSRSIDPLSESVRNQSLSVEYFDKTINPGMALRNSIRHQGRRVQAFVISGDDIELLTFDGEIESFSYDINECKVSFTASSQRKSTKILFPPGSLLEEGRFVERKILDTGQYLQTSYNQRLQYLVPIVEFNSIFGTPSSPVAGYSFLRSEILVDTATYYQPAGAYLFFDDKASDLAVPVIYGSNTNVALNILGHYRVSHSSSVYAKIYICIVASHLVIGDPSISSPIGDFGVYVKSGTITLQNVYGGFETDRLNSSFSYLTIPVLYTSSTFETLDPIYPSNFDFYESYISEIIGKPDASGSSLSGLYDVISDIWMSYGGGVQDQVDWKTSEESRSSLNSFEVGAVFNDRQENQTLLDVLSQRFQSQFPVTFGFPFGRLAWQAALFVSPGAAVKPVKNITYGVNAIGRDELSQTGISSILNNIKLSFGVNGNSGEDSSSITIDSSNNEIARSSEDRWGKSDISDIRVQDTQYYDTAVLIGINRLIAAAGVRFNVSYVMSDLSFVSLPMMSIVSVTDEQCGFEDEPFYFLGIEWSKDLTVFNVKLLSVKMI